MFGIMKLQPTYASRSRLGQHDNVGLLCVSQEARRVMEEEEQREIARLENHLARERVRACLDWFLEAHRRDK